LRHTCRGPPAAANLEVCAHTSRSRPAAANLEVCATPVAVRPPPQTWRCAPHLSQSARSRKPGGLRHALERFAPRIGEVCATHWRGLRHSCPGRSVRVVCCSFQQIAIAEKTSDCSVIQQCRTFRYIVKSFTKQLSAAARWGRISSRGRGRRPCRGHFLLATRWLHFLSSVAFVGDIALPSCRLLPLRVR
jgi:hypothetical protein